MALPKGITSKKSVSHIPYSACVAKTTPSGSLGLSVQEHCEHVGTVAKALVQRLPEAAKRLIPNDVITLVALHDIGKVSPGFQKRIQRDSPDILPADLFQGLIDNLWFIGHFYCDDNQGCRFREVFKYLEPTILRGIKFEPTCPFTSLGCRK